MWERQSKQAQSLGWLGEGRGGEYEQDTDKERERHCKERQRQRKEEETVVGEKGRRSCRMRRCKNNRR